MVQNENRERVNQIAPALWDARQTANHIGIAYQTLRQLVSERKIPFIKIGSRCLFDPVEISAWIDERRQPAVTTPGGAR